MKLSGKEFRIFGVIHLKVDQVDLEEANKSLPVHWGSLRFAEDPNYRVAENCKNDGGRPGDTWGT